jgi:hypothetical protein
MKITIVASLMIAVSVSPALAQDAKSVRAVDADIGRLDISSVPIDADRTLRSATFTPSGKILVSYHDKGDTDPLLVKLAIMDEGGGNFRPIFSQVLPNVEKNNGLRYMVFDDNKRVFLGDFIVECAPSLDACAKSALLPVDYPAEVASGAHIGHRWSEIVTAPDNKHIAWTTLLADYSSLVFVGELQKVGSRYKVIKTRIVSTLAPFAKDPAHSDGVLPQPMHGGEVKQFVAGGTALSLVGAVTRDTPDSVVHHLDTNRTEAITNTAGYTETTIFSPDERLGMTMTTRFSQSDPAILGLMPRPYPASLGMGLSMLAYTYAVTGVRRARPGNIGPALIDVAASKTDADYTGTNLSSSEQWVMQSPMSWHPSSKKALWIEGNRSDDTVRIRVVSLPDYKPGPRVAARPFPSTIPGSSADLSLVKSYSQSAKNIDVKVYGRVSGSIRFRHTPNGVVEKTYANFSDTPEAVYDGSERLEVNLAGRSTYIAKVRLTGAKPGTMDLKMTFGPLSGRLPAQLIFDEDPSGKPLTNGYAEYDGRRLSADKLIP